MPEEQQKQREYRFKSTPPDEASHTLYKGVMEDGSELEVSVHPNRSLCRIMLSYENVMEEVELRLVNSRPVFRKTFYSDHSTISDDGKPVNHTNEYPDVVRLYYHLPKAIQLGLGGKSEKLLNEYFSAYARRMVN
jgi:hypothetical protein